MEYTDILYETSAGKARITINRPETLNAFSSHTCVEIIDAILTADEDPEIGVIVLTGAGDRAFSSGGDVKWDIENLKDYTHLDYPDMVGAMRKCTKPIIAAVKGYAVGGGNWLAYFCDLTIAADNAIFGQNGARVASPAGGYWVNYATRLMGEKRAREMWYLCRRYTAQEAKEMGLVNFVVPLDRFDEEVDRLAEEILDKSPTVLKLLKYSFDMASDFQRGYSYTLVQKMFAPDFVHGPENREGEYAFVEKRQPNFRQFRKRTETNS